MSARVVIFFFKSAVDVNDFYALTIIDKIFGTSGNSSPGSTHSVPVCDEFPPSLASSQTTQFCN